MAVFSRISLFGRRALLAAALALPLSGAAAEAADTSARFPAPPQAAQTAPMLPPPAQAAPYRGICSSFLVRAEAKQRFGMQVRGVPYEPRLVIKAFSDVAEVQAQTGPESYDIDRHYCSATVLMNNGQSYPAVYSVARNQGFAGIGGLHVSFCVTGLDNWLVRDNDCRSLRAPRYSVY